MSIEQKASSPFLAALVAGRQQVAIGLVVAGVILGSISIWFGIWGFARSEPTSAEKVDGKLVPGELNKPAEEAKDDGKPKKSPDYQIASIWAGAIALIALLSAVWVFTQPADPVAPESSARKELLFFGGTVGLLTALSGAFLGYRWHQSLVKWVGTDDASEAKWVLYAFAVFFAGLLIMFISIQLARSEERANAGLRRVLYGFNSVFVGLLLLLVLAAVNVVAFIRLPGTLATNDSAFTELSPESKTFLSSLDRPVNVYLIMTENYSEQLGGRLTYDNLYADCRGLLSQCEDQSKNFHATYLSPAFDKERIAALMDRLKIKEADRDQLGMLAAVGENEEATTFVRANELIDVDRRNQLVFQGENKLLTELMYLTDARAKEKIYFTQGHGELTLEPGQARDKSASGVVQFLRDRKMNVEPITFEKPEDKIPEDAAVVVVAGLRRTLAPNDPMVVALGEYLRRADKPGKLLLCLPAFRDPEGKVARTGLEPLLTDFGVEQDPNHRILSFPGTLSAPPDYILVAPYRIEGDLSRVVGQVPLVLKETRPVRPTQNAQAGMYRVMPLMGTDMRTWQEEDYLTAPDLLLRELLNDKSGETGIAKRFTGRPIPVAVAVVETSAGGEKPIQKPKMIVFGSETFLQDQGPVVSGAEEFRQQFLSDSIDWLRERDANIGIPPRKVGVFALEKPIEWSSQVVLLALVSVGIVSLGVSVWLSRRR